MPPNPLTPSFPARSSARQLERAGMIRSPVAGRTDRIGMSVKPNSYVLPSDIVSGVGQGNSAAGAQAFNQLLKMGPFGAATPRMPSPRMGKPRFADGGATPGEAEPVDIVAAGGEFVIPAEKVAEIGDGDVEIGHQILDQMVANIRKNTIKTLKRLPGPKKR